MKSQRECIWILISGTDQHSHTGEQSWQLKLLSQIFFNGCCGYTLCNYRHDGCHEDYGLYISSMCLWDSSLRQWVRTGACVCLFDVVSRGFVCMCVHLCTSFVSSHTFKSQWHLNHSLLFDFRADLRSKSMSSHSLHFTDVCRSVGIRNERAGGWFNCCRRSFLSH